MHNEPVFKRRKRKQWKAQPSASIFPAPAGVCGCETEINQWGHLCLSVWSLAHPVQSLPVRWFHSPQGKPPAQGGVETESGWAAAGRGPRQQLGGPAWVLSLSALCPAPMSVAPACFVTFPMSPLSLLTPSERQGSGSQPAALSVSRRAGVLVPDLEEKQADPGAGLPFGTVEKVSHEEGGLLIQRELALLRAGGLQVWLEAQARWTEHPSTA